VAAGYQTALVQIKTTGDQVPEIPLAQIGSRALFTKQIDDALLEDRIDLAVHSCKDLPTQLPSGIRLAAVGPREDPRDALVGRGSLRWSDLPHGSVIGTSSLRRRAQLLNLRPDLSVVDVRGNVETRLAKLDAHPTWTAIVLAAAGLIRLGLEQRIGERLAVDLMLPAPGQGALAITVRSNDPRSNKAARDAVHDPATAIAVSAERSFLRRLEGGCQVPIGAYAELETTGSLRLRGRVISLRGERKIEAQELGVVRDEEEAAALGTRLAERLLGQGAGNMLRDIRAIGAPAVTEP
jgi:hydroxymethylbilane synthase